jgi:hypothetical protein
MTELAFKQGLYPYYAPLLFKFVRVFARYKLWRWRESADQLDALAQHYWDRFLANRFEQELRNRGKSIYQGLTVLQENDKTAYIIGCGPSINQVSAKQWAHIGEHFSIGLNHFYVHEFTPNCYFCEFANNPEFLALIYQRLLDNPQRQQSQVNISGHYILFRGQGYRAPAVQNPFFYITRSLRLTSKNLLKKLTKTYFEMDTPFVTHHISNLDTAIHCAVKQGFKDICLVGIDLNNDGYFWDHEDKPFYQDARDFIRSFHQQVEYKQDGQGVHATASEEVAQKLGKLTISEYLELLHEHVLSPLGITLWVHNESSLLAKVLPVKKLDQLGKNNV